jgi:hypothetical protein
MFERKIALLQAMKYLSRGIRFLNFCGYEKTICARPIHLTGHDTTVCFEGLRNFPLISLAK